MFEDSLVESRGFEVSSSKRWTTLGSIGLQVAVAGVVIALPLLHPEALPFRFEAPRVLVPLVPKPPVPVERVQREAAASPSSAAAPIAMRPLIPAMPTNGETANNDPPSLTPIGMRMGMPEGLPIGAGVGDGHGPVVSVAPARSAAVPLKVSTGVLEGMLIAPIRPVYPAIARAAHVEGTVIVEAVISRTGTIESLRVVSGPQMLQSAAMEAIREARYQPYRLNGEPTEVRTRITVNFRMGG
jgi:periplasmic protein TonB